MAVIGCGYWGPNHIRNMSIDPRIELKYACDLNEDRRGYVAMRYPHVAVVNDHRVILEDESVGAVVIATPVATHYPLALECLEAGKHVLLEKPMASSTVQGEHLLRVARNNQLTLMIGHTFLFHGCIQEIRKMLERRALGELYYIQIQRLNLGLFQRDINVVWDLAAHDIAILSYLLHQSPSEVSAIGKVNVYGDIEDVAIVTLKYHDGLMVFMHLSWIDPHKVRQMTLIGAEKMLVYNDVEPVYKLKIYDKSVTRPKHYDTFEDFQFSYRYGDISSPLIPMEEPLKEEKNHFLDCIQMQSACISDGQLGVDVLKVLEASQRSIKNAGRWETVLKETDCQDRHHRTLQDYEL